MSQANQLQQKNFAFSWCLPVASSLGATALSLGVVTLFAGRRDAVTHAFPLLAIRVADWLFFSAGILLLLASSVILGVTVHRNRLIRLAWNGVGESAVERQARETTVLKPSSSKILTGLLTLVLLGIGLPAFALTTFLMKPAPSLAFIVIFFFWIGFFMLTAVADSLSCRVQVLAEEIRCWSWFRAKAFPAVEIRSAQYSSYRGTVSLAILGDRSWFKVTSDSFDPSQLDTIRRFCDKAASLYPDWRSPGASTG